ncbi:putative riboflavin synthase, beta subunit [Candidatus Zinderia insecticola CARI]|uniref:6,7-dimethyl-8-ribityllumazine synthase n=1 Tax=Zinderia insecticola (strain CARI) TaxID=871271 RepID=E0TIL7_ZINIC|nr:putative riboflavin synthase, beta subunit [Candidatus Zinderia insecticola CARI]
MNKVKGLLIISCYNNKLCSLLLESIFKHMIIYKINEKNLIYLKIPGSLEFSWIIKKLLNFNFINFIFVLGIIIKGKTIHYKLVSNISYYYINKLSYNINIPLINLLITINNVNQFLNRIKYNILNSIYNILKISNLNKILLWELQQIN